MFDKIIFYIKIDKENNSSNDKYCIYIRQRKNKGNKGKSKKYQDHA